MAKVIENFVQVRPFKTELLVLSLRHKRRRRRAKMKSKRAKANRKTMHLYTSVFKFRQPYQVLIDAEFAITAVVQKMDVVARLEAVFGGLVKPMMTQCTMAHLYDLPSPSDSSPAQQAIALSRSAFQRRLCNHWSTKPSTSDCLVGVIGPENPLRYCVATQDAELRRKLREDVPGVPVVYVNRGGVLVLEEEGVATEGKRAEVERMKQAVGEEEREVLGKAKVRGATLSGGAKGPADEPASGAGHDPSAVGAGRTGAKEGVKGAGAKERWEKRLGKKKGAKGPNPLSVKKKKKPAQQGKPRSSAGQEIKGGGPKKRKGKPPGPAQGAAAASQ